MNGPIFECYRIKMEEKKVHHSIQGYDLHASLPLKFKKIIKPLILIKAEAIYYLRGKREEIVRSLASRISNVQTLSQTFSKYFRGRAMAYGDPPMRFSFRHWSNRSL